MKMRIVDIHESDSYHPAKDKFFDGVPGEINVAIGQVIEATVEEVWITGPVAGYSTGVFYVDGDSEEHVFYAFKLEEVK